MAKAVPPLADQIARLESALHRSCLEYKKKEPPMAAVVAGADKGRGPESQRWPPSNRPLPFRIAGHFRGRGRWPRDGGGNRAFHVLAGRRPAADFLPVLAHRFAPLGAPAP